MQPVKGGRLYKTNTATNMMRQTAVVIHTIRGIRFAAALHYKCMEDWRGLALFNTRGAVPSEQISMMRAAVNLGKTLAL
jgi:hypothetical protein